MPKVNSRKKSSFILKSIRKSDRKSNENISEKVQKQKASKNVIAGQTLLFYMK